MPKPSKEDKVLELFFNSTKHWHFEELLKQTKLSRGRLNNWLIKFVGEGLIKRIKEKGRMPYYIANTEHPSYRNKKRIYALNKFYKTGFLNHLQSLQKAKAIVIFGSFSRWDWYKDSDIDLFILGDDSDFEQGKYESKLHREMQVFTAKTRKDLKKLGKGLIRNIISGYLVKGNMDFLEVRSA